MDNENKIKNIYPTYLVSLKGIVNKRGESWVQIKENSEPRVYNVITKDPAGNEIKTSEVHHPAKALIVYRKDLKNAQKIVEGVEQIYIVEPSIDWDSRNKKPVIKYWLRDVNSVA